MSHLAALVTCYRGSRAAYLQQALDSLRVQTRPADETVIVADGPLPDDVAAVLAQYVAEVPNSRIVTLATTRGAGAARHAGWLTMGEHVDFVAVVDHDDLSHPQRFAEELAVLEADQQIAAVGLPVIEFAGTATISAPTTPGGIASITVTEQLGVRRMPGQNRDLKRLALINSPLNNPTVMLRASALREVGGWRNLYLMEDYDLLVRLVAKGYELKNIDAAPCFFRVDPELWHRRKGGGDLLKLVKTEVAFAKNLVELGLEGKPRAYATLAVRLAYRVAPQGLLQKVYPVLFHRG